MVLTLGVVFGRAAPKKGGPFAHDGTKLARANTRTVARSLKTHPSGRKKRVAHNGSEPTPPRLRPRSSPDDPPLYRQRRRCGAVRERVCAIGNFRNIYPRTSYCRPKNGRNFIVSSIFSYVFTSGARELVFRPLFTTVSLLPALRSDHSQPAQPGLFLSSLVNPFCQPPRVRRIEVRLGITREKNSSIIGGEKMSRVKSTSRRRHCGRELGRAPRFVRFIVSRINRRIRLTRVESTIFADEDITCSAVIIY